MKKVQTKNKLKGFFGLFAAFALAIGVGVSLAPKEVVKTEAATESFSINLRGKVLADSASYVGTETTNTAYNGGTSSATIKWNNINPNSGQLRGNQTTQTNMQSGANFYIRNATELPGNIRSVAINYTSADSTFVPKDIHAATGSAEITNQSIGGSTAGAKGTGSVVTWSFTGESGKYFAIGTIKGGTSGSALGQTIVVTYETGGGQPPVQFGTLTSIAIKAASTKLSFQVGETFSRPGLVIIASDNSTPVVTKDLTTGFTTNREGLVFTASHLGQLTVTVSYTEGVTKTVDYLITVVPVPVLKTYKAVTTVAELYIGSTYIIAGVKSSTPYTMSITGTTNRASLVASYDNGDIKEPENTQKFELVAGLNSGEYAFKTINGTADKYIYAASSSANQLASEDTITVNSSWKLTFNNGVLAAVAVNSSNRNIMRFNSANNPPLFSCYASGQDPVSLHVDEDTIPVSGFGTLDHITVNTGGAQTTYYAGEKFNTVGLVVTAFDTKPEPESKVVVGFTTSIIEDTVLSSLGEHTVTVTYIEGVSKSTTYKINVLRAQTYTKLATADEIRFGQMYALGTAEGAASTTVGTFAGEVAVTYNEADDSFTTVTNLQLVALRIGDVKESYAIELLNGPSAGKYYSWTNGNEIRVSNEINEESSWFIAFDGEVLKITHAVDPTRFIGHNHEFTRFAAYTGTGQAKASLFMDFASYEVEQEVMTLADAVNTGIGNNANKSCHAAYEFLSDVYSRLSIAGKAFFDVDEDYADINSARERMLYLAAWTAANSDIPDSKINSPVNDNNSLTATIIIGVIGLTTLAGYYFLQKKKEA